MRVPTIHFLRLRGKKSESEKGCHLSKIHHLKTILIVCSKEYFLFLFFMSSNVTQF